MSKDRTFDQIILDGVDVGIVTTDDAGKVTFVNRAATEILELDPTLDRDPVGSDVGALLALTEPLDALVGDSSRRGMSHLLVTARGSELDLEISVSRAEDAVHERIGFFFIFRDVREEKARETERRRFERLVAMGTMVAGFAHEVRNPVAALRSLAESLAEELSDDELLLSHVTRMLQVLERIERLVRTSLQFGRPTAPRRAPHRPWNILNQAVAQLAPRSGPLAGKLRVEVEPELPDVYVDDAQLTQVLIILLNNALDAAGAHGRLVLRAVGTKPTDDAGRGRKSVPPPPPSSPRGAAPCPVVKFEVIDDGPGIPAGILGRIFDPFFTTKPSGTGLGLSIAQQIVNENGGRLEVTSPRGGPTTFSVFAPSDSAVPRD